MYGCDDEQRQRLCIDVWRQLSRLYVFFNAVADYRCDRVADLGNSPLNIYRVFRYAGRRARQKTAFWGLVTGKGRRCRNEEIVYCLARTWCRCERNGQRFGITCIASGCFEKQLLLVTKCIV